MSKVCASGGPMSMSLRYSNDFLNSLGWKGDIEANDGPVCGGVDFRVISAIFLLRRMVRR
jgi:hypothetical protein